MVLSKEVGYMHPELKKVKAGDADLAVFSTYQVVKNSVGNVRAQPEGKERVARKVTLEKPDIRGQAEKESVRRLKQNDENN